MAIAVMADTPGVTAEQFEAMQGQLNLMVEPPRGGLAQLAGPVGGSWRVITVWESQEAWDAFRRDRLEPAFQRLGMPAPQFQVWPIHSMMTSPR
ncbi:MAG TPA: hypothetical protein VF808_11210 [Ktedonobacterales bacterium]